MKQVLKLIMAIAALVLFAILAVNLVGMIGLAIEPRAITPLKWLVEKMVTGPFGASGTMNWIAAFFASAALLLVGDFVSYWREQREKVTGPRDISASRAGRSSRYGDVKTAAPKAEFDDIWEHLNDSFERDIVPRRAWRLDYSDQSESALASATSWIGGLPMVPNNFVWPVSGSGKAMAFLAQIDLGSTSFGGADGHNHPGMPTSGVMLFFLGTGARLEQRVVTIPAGKMKHAVERERPADTHSITEYGIHDSGGDVIPRTVATLRSYLDDDTITPVSKFLGVENQDGTYGFHYPRDFATLLYVELCEKLHTCNGHWYGLAIACPAEDLDRGIFDRAQVFGNVSV